MSTGSLLFRRFIYPLTAYFCMTIQFLSQSPSTKQTTNHLSHVLTSGEDPGRIYLLTGNISTGQKIRQEFLNIVEWTMAAPDRELVLLVGVFKKPQDKDKEWVLDSTPVENEVASLVAQTGIAYLQKKKLARARFPITVHAAEAWHIKAIGLTGRGLDFFKATAAIFGSTNFTTSARHGSNFEMDVYVDGSTAQGKSLLTSYTHKVGYLIQEAIQGPAKIAHFHARVAAAVGAQTGQTVVV